MKKVIILLIICLALLGAYLIVRFNKGLSGYTKESSLIRLEENILIIVEALNRWSVDNNGIMPTSFNNKSMKAGLEFKSYLLKPIEQSYLQASGKMECFVLFVNDTLPQDVDKIWKTGQIFVYNNNNKFIVLGFGEKDQRCIRSDTEEFQRHYNMYINEYWRIYKK